MRHLLAGVSHPLARRAHEVGVHVAEKRHVLLPAGGVRLELASGALLERLPGQRPEAVIRPIDQVGVVHDAQVDAVDAGVERSLNPFEPVAMDFRVAGVRLTW